MGKKIKVVLDSNVWISIFMKKTLGREFSRIFEMEKVEVYVSETILREISRVLVYPKIKRLLKDSGVTIEIIIQQILEKSNVTKPKSKLNVIKEDPEDNRILECAVKANADFIVSGNRHLLELKKYDSIKIVTPRQLIEELEYQKSR